MPSTLIDRTATLADYVAGPRRLTELIANLDEAALNATPAAGEWTIREITHHIVDGDDLWSVGIKAAIGNPDGIFTLQWYWDVPQTTWAKKWRYADRDVCLSLELFKTSRQCVVQLLEIEPEAWERSITIHWEGRGDDRVSVAQMIASQARHALGHIAEIAAALE
jgi:hypothetical protein